MVTITINYPSTLDALTRWSKRLFAVYHACGFVGSLCLVGGIFLAFAGKPWWLVAVVVGCLLLGAVMSALEPLMSEVDMRRYAAIEAQHADKA